VGNLRLDSDITPIWRPDSLYVNNAEARLALGGVEVNDPLCKVTSEMTITVRASCGSGGTEHPIFRTNKATIGSYSLVFIATRNPRFEIHDGTSYRNVNCGIACDVDKLYTITGVWKRGSMWIYLDGVLKNSASGYGTNLSVSPVQFLTVLSYRSSSSAWNTGYLGLGKVEYAYLFNRALTPTEVLSLHESPYQFISSPRIYTTEAAPPSGVVPLRCLMGVGV
jgi:hypothetical protein